ncbi:MAG: hypothetical protein ACREJC_21335 [Tepidisphaeraceae bacterium]
MRCKSSGRKGPKRPPPKDAVPDDELTELAAVIAEHSLDNNAENWFSIPWRDGWNAVELAAAVAEPDSWLRDVCQNRRTEQDVYWEAQDRLALMPSKMSRAALRCLQILIAKSDGGGEVYNAILLAPFSVLLPENVDRLVRDYRCHDSIGLYPKPQGDEHDRLRRAFSIAWDRGLYHAAYSLPRVSLTRLSVVKEKP